MFYHLDINMSIRMYMYIYILTLYNQLTCYIRKQILDHQTTFINQTAFLKVFRCTWHWETSDLARSKNKDNFCVSCVHNKHSSSRMRGIPFNTLNVSYFWNVAFLNALFPKFQESKRYHLRVLQVLLKSPRCSMSTNTMFKHVKCTSLTAWVRQIFRLISSFTAPNPEIQCQLVNFCLGQWRTLTVSPPDTPASASLPAPGTKNLDTRSPPRQRSAENKSGNQRSSAVHFITGGEVVT